MACCDHTCNNPLLNQMVVSLISMPGVLSPEMVMKFQAAVEKAGGAKLSDQIRRHQERLRQAHRAPGAGDPGKHSENQPERTADASSPRPAESVPVRGFKMEMKRPAEKTDVPSSGLKWTILLAVFLLIGVFFLGARHKSE